MPKLLVATDIFGITEATMEFCEGLEQDYSCIGPYGTDISVFDDETHAYAHFSNATSVLRYADSIREKIFSNLQYSHFIGFSVGASALWALSPEMSVFPTAKLTGFYGGQIRHLTSLQPSVPTHLIFPKSEPHFNVVELIDRLNRKNNVDITMTAFNHGFMNRLSENFDADGYASMTPLLRDWLTQDHD